MREKIDSSSMSDKWRFCLADNEVVCQNAFLLVSVEFPVVLRAVRLQPVETAFSVRDSRGKDNDLFELVTVDVVCGRSCLACA